MQASTITRNVLRNHWLPVSPAMIAAWWPGASFPLALSLQLVVGDARGAPLAASIKKKAQTGGRAGFALQAPGRLPLPVGTAVLRFKKTGPASLEMHVRLPGTALRPRPPLLRRQPLMTMTAAPRIVRHRSRALRHRLCSSSL